MNYQTFLAVIIADGIAAANYDYPADTRKREGSVAGFNACSGKNPDELRQLLRDAHTETIRARHGSREYFWWYRCFELEVIWVCNCVSAYQIRLGEYPITIPTARGTLKAAAVLMEEKGSL